MVSAPPCSSSYITFSPLKLRPAQTYRFKKKLLRQAFDNNLYSGHSLRGEGEEETCFVLTMILSGRLKQKTIMEMEERGGGLRGRGSGGYGRVRTRPDRDKTLSAAPGKTAKKKNLLEFCIFYLL